MVFQEYLQQKFKINEELPFAISSHQYKKGEIITPIETVERNIYYVVSGIVEICMPIKTGDRIMDIAFGGQMTTVLSSMLSEKPSDVFLVALTNCEIQAIPFAKLKEACKTPSVASKFYTSFMEHAYLVRIKKEKNFLTKNAKQRYLDLLKNRPEIIQEISIDHIAKYLGINAHSLSRIRGEIARNSEKMPADNNR